MSPVSSPNYGDQDHAQTTLRVREAARGDRTATEWVVGHLTPVLVAAADYHLRGTPHGKCDAEDVVQETWLVALPKFGSLVERSGRLTPVLMTFLGTILHRQIGRSWRRGGAIGRGTRQIDPDVEYDPTDTRTGVVTAASRSESASRVQDALAAMPDEVREILILRGVDGLSYEEIATRLKITAGAGRVRYFRALDRLRSALPGDFLEEWRGFESSGDA